MTQPSSNNPFEQAISDPDYVPKSVESNGGSSSPTEAEIEAAKAAEAQKSNIPTPDVVFGEEYKDRKWEDVKTVFDEKTQKLSEYEAELAELKTKKPNYSKPEVAEWDAWLGNGGIEDYGIFTKIKTLDADSLDHIDALVTKRLIENPEFRGMESQIKKEYIDKYNLESTEEKPLTDEQIKFNQAKIAVEGKEAKQFLSGLKSKLQVQQPDPEAKTKSIEKKKSDWMPIIDQVFGELKTVKIPVLKKDGTGKTVKDDKGNDMIESLADFQVPEHLQAKLKNEYQSEVEKFPNVDAKSAELLKASALNRIVVDNLPYIVSSALQQKETELHDFYQKKYGGQVLKQPGASGGQPPSESNKDTMENYRKTVHS